MTLPILPPEARARLASFGLLALRETLTNVEIRRPLSVGQLASCLLLASPTMDRGAVAAELGVSEGFLSRTIHRDLGVTFVEQRARTRVAHFPALVEAKGSTFSMRLFSAPGHRRPRFARVERRGDAVGRAAAAGAALATL